MKPNDSCHLCLDSDLTAYGQETKFGKALGSKSMEDCQNGKTRFEFYKQQAQAPKPRLMKFQSFSRQLVAMRKTAVRVHLL